MYRKLWMAVQVGKLQNNYISIISCLCFLLFLCTDLVEKAREETIRQVRRESENIQEAVEHSSKQLKTGV